MEKPNHHEHEHIIRLAAAEVGIDARTLTRHMYGERVRGAYIRERAVRAAARVRQLIEEESSGRPLPPRAA